jgi:hypothetical protein
MPTVIPPMEARFYFHEVTPHMMENPAFPQSIALAFRRAIQDDFYQEKHLAFASFSGMHFVLLTSFFEFFPCDLSNSELIKILDICQNDMCYAGGSPSEIDLDRLHKYRLEPA